MDTLKTVAVITASTLLIWLSAAMAAAATQDSRIENAAAIIAFLSTLTFGIVAGLNAIDERHNAALRQLDAPGSKAKREAAPAQDARLALLLSLLSDEERASLKRRLIDDLAGDGEVLSMAELLAAQDAEREYRGRS